MKVPGKRARPVRARPEVKRFRRVLELRGDEQRWRPFAAVARRYRAGGEPITPELVDELIEAFADKSDTAAYIVGVLQEKIDTYRDAALALRYVRARAAPRLPELRWWRSEFGGSGGGFLDVAKRYRDGGSAVPIAALQELAWTHDAADNVAGKLVVMLESRLGVHRGDSTAALEALAAECAVRPERRQAQQQISRQVSGLLNLMENQAGDRADEQVAYLWGLIRQCCARAPDCGHVDSPATVRVRRIVQGAVEGAVPADAVIGRLYQMRRG